MGTKQQCGKIEVTPQTKPNTKTSPTLQGLVFWIRCVPLFRLVTTWKEACDGKCV